MVKKKHRLLYSQICGTVWFAVVLIAILAFVFFFFPKSNNNPQQASKEQKNIAELQKKEDSVYRSRRARSDERGVISDERPSSNARHSSFNTQHSSLNTQQYYTSEPPAPTRKPLVVELNSADTTTLQLLHGIGPAYARRIINYREKLGGFTSTDQLLEVYGFTPELLNHILPHLHLDTHELRKIDINTMTLKQLIKHPYMEYYFARDLVNLRSRGVVFSAPDDLRAIPSCTDTMLTRLLPYLDFGK